MQEENVIINTRTEIQTELTDLQTRVNALVEIQRQRSRAPNKNHGHHEAIAGSYQHLGREIEKWLRDLPFPEPADSNLRYTGRYTSARTVTVAYQDENGQRQNEALPPRTDLVDHSPTGFSWGYAGSGPAQLALAILCHFSKDDQYAIRHYQDFKSEVISRIRRNQWTMQGEQVSSWIADNP